MNVFADSDEAYLRSRREHPAIWDGIHRFTSHCPNCGRGMRSASHLQVVPTEPDGLRMCASCRRWHLKLNRTEPKRSL
jgi:hypothetical protein